MNKLLYRGIIGIILDIVIIGLAAAMVIGKIPPSGRDEILKLCIGVGVMIAFLVSLVQDIRKVIVALHQEDNE